MNGMVRCDSGSDGMDTALRITRVDHVRGDVEVLISTGLVSVLEEGSVSN